MNHNELHDSIKFSSLTSLSILHHVLFSDVIVHNGVWMGLGSKQMYRGNICGLLRAAKVLMDFKV